MSVRSVRRLDVILGCRLFKRYARSLLLDLVAHSNIVLMLACLGLTIVNIERTRAHLERLLCKRGPTRAFISSDA